jgi:mono/diheme cytochrome c family protein
MRRMERIAAFGLAATLGLALHRCPPPAEEVPPVDEPPVEPADPPVGVAPELPPGVTEQQVATGEELFRGTAQCHTCHGPDAQGTPLAPNLTEGPWINLDTGSLEEIEENIRTGVPQPVEYPAPMPPMGGAQLTDEQIDDVAAYVYSISRGKN